MLLATCSRRYARARSKSFALESVPGHDWEVALEYLPTSHSDTGQPPPRSDTDGVASSLVRGADGGAADGTVARIVARVEAAAAKHEANADIPYRNLHSLRTCGLSTVIWEREDGDFDVAHYEDIEFQCGYICPADTEKGCHTFRLPSNPVI